MDFKPNKFLHCHKYYICLKITYFTFEKEYSKPSLIPLPPLCLNLLNLDNQSIYI